MSDAPYHRRARPDPSAYTRTQRGIDTEAISATSGPPPRSRDLLEGATLVHFEIVSRLGRGGMGVVYKALDTRLRRFVALKVLDGGTSSEGTERSLFREARRAAALVHQGITTVYEVYEKHQPPFFVMEFVDGESLRLRLKDGRIPVDEAVRIALQLARALGHAHAAGIVHRDVKPENVMIAHDGAVKLLDFGIAKVLMGARTSAAPDRAVESAILTAHGTIIGTPEYMAPEQALGRPVDARADVFAVGVVLYEMLAGERPFHRATEIETAIAVVRDEAPRLDARGGELRPSVVRIVDRCLAKSAEDRIENGTMLAEALVAAHETTSPRKNRWRAHVLSAAVSFVMLAGMIAVLQHRRTKKLDQGHIEVVAQHPSSVQASMPQPIALPIDAFCGQFAAISHDGQLFAIPTADGTISVMRLGEIRGHYISLPHPGFACKRLSFAEDNLSILTEELVENGVAMWRVPIDGSSSVKLRTLYTIPRAISVADAGGKVAVVDDEGIWVGPSSMDSMRRIATFSHNLAPSSIAWSPDGHRIATVSRSEAKVTIEIIDANGGGRSTVLTNHFQNWAFGAPTLAWSSNETIMYMRGEAKSFAFTWLMEIAADGRPAESLELERLPGTGYEIISRAGSRLFVRHVQGTNGTAVGEIGARRADLRVEREDSAPSARAHFPLGWWPGGGFVYGTAQNGKWTVGFEHEEWNQASFWKERSFTARPFLIYDGLGSWQNPGNAPECAFVSRRHGRRDQVLWTSDATVACGSVVKCALGKPGSCIVSEEHLGTSSLTLFDVDHGERRRLLFTSESKIIAESISGDGKTVALMQNGRLKAIEIASNLVSDVPVHFIEPQFGAALPHGEYLVVGEGADGSVLAAVSRGGEVRVLWTSRDTWLGPPVVSPSGKSVTMHTITMADELVVLDH